MVGGGAKEPGIVGIAADHAIEGNDIGRGDRWSELAEVSVREGRSVRVAKAPRFRHGDLEVGLGRINLSSPGKTVLEQDVLNGPDPSADVEKSRLGGQRGCSQRREELPRGRIGTPPAETPQVVLGDRPVELLVGGAAMAGAH